MTTLRTGPKGADAILVMPKVGYMDALRSNPGLPLSLLHACSKATDDYDIRIVDLRNTINWKSAIREHVGSNTKLVGITSFTGRMMLSALQITNYAKFELGLPVVWGGIHASMNPKEVISDSRVDYVVAGEGEYVFATLMDALSQGKELPKDVPGLAFMDDGEPHYTPFQAITEIDGIPEAPYHLVDVDQYLPVYGGKRTFYFQASRGCPRHCTYCYIQQYTKANWYAQTAQHTIDRLEYAAKKFNFENVYFLDDNFFVDFDRAFEIAEWFVDKPFGYSLQGVEATDIVEFTPDQLRLLERSGCNRVTVGVETGSKRMRKLLGKRGTPDQCREAVRILRGYDIKVYCSFLTALPGETVEDLKSTIAIHQELPRINPNVHTSPIYNFCPYPGTPLYTYAKRMGFEPPTTLEGWSKVSWEDNVVTNNTGYSSEFFEALYFSTLFLDNKVDFYSDTKWVKMLAKAYRPLARWRVNNMNFKYMPERAVARWLEGRMTN